LGLILDLELPIGALVQTPGTTPVTGKIRAWIGDPATPLTTPIWTAFKLSPAAAGSTAGDFFGPISKYAHGHPDTLSFASQLHIDDGLVNLNVKTNDNAVYRYVMLNC